MHPARKIRYQNCFEHIQSFPFPLMDKNFEGQAPRVVLQACQYPSLDPKHRLRGRPFLCLSRSLKPGYLYPRRAVDSYRVAHDGCTLNKGVPRYKPFLCSHSYHKHAYACRLGDSWASLCHFRVVSCMISNGVVIHHLIVH
jgi:hypothetical protein